MKPFNRIGLVALFLAQSNLPGFAQSGIISTVAGNGTAGFSGDGGLATAAQIHAPYGVAADSAGNLYIADQSNNRIRAVTAAGVISTLAGIGTAGFSGDGGQAAAAQLNFPSGVAVDSTGNIFIADLNNSRIRKVTTAGVISTVAGTGSQGFSGDGGPATAAQLNFPIGLAVDSLGNLYIADQANNRIRKVTAFGVITTVAGNGTAGFSGDGGLATSAQLNSPAGVAVTPSGNLYIADRGNNRIRKVTTFGVITTVAGNGTAGFSGDGGKATAAQLSGPTGLAVDSAGNLYIADYANNRVRGVTAAGVISTVAGNGTTGQCGDGAQAAGAQLNGPSGAAVDSAGNLYIADYLNDRVRSVTSVSFADIFFPQVAVGGGYSTLFTITNTGADAASGSLVLTDQQGNPFSVSATLTDSSGVTQPSSPGSTFALTIPSGATVFLLASGLAADSPQQVGWAQLGSSGGSLSAVATYEYVVGGATQTIVGVLQSRALQFATVAVDNNSSQDKQTAYAIANPGNRTISVRLALVGQDGTVVDNSVTLTLGPGQQIARYLWQDLARTDFRGSVVFRGQARVTFIVVALVEKRHLLTAIPLISGKAPGVPN